MTGPEGPYELSFKSLDDWDGEIETTMAGVPMTWPVLRSDEAPDGTVTVSGMTVGSIDVWSDQFWFELVIRPPHTITYWGDNVIWRTDMAMEQQP